MKRVTVMLLLLAGCASQPQEVPEIEGSSAVEDFIEINDLQEVDVARTIHRFDFSVVNEYYVIIDTRRSLYLAEMFGPCREPTDMRVVVEPDLRHEPKNLRAGADTIKGCRIKTIYEIDEAQVLELEEIGEAPGQRETRKG